MDLAADPAAAQLALHQMNQQMNQQQGEIVRLHAEGVALQQQLVLSENARRALAVAAAVVAVPVRDHHRPKIPSPSVFAGAIGTAVDEFMHGIDKQFGYYREMFADEQQKVEYASNYLTMRAAAWYQARKEELAKDGQTIGSWAQLKSELRERFQPIGSAAIARQSLDVYKQLSSVQSYSEHFYRCMSYITDMGDADQVHQFTRGLKDRIRQEVIREQPVTVNNAVNIAVKAESFLGLTLAHSFGSQGRFQPRQQSSASSSRADGSTSTAMDVNSVEFGQDFVESAEPAGTEPSSRERALMAQIADLHAHQKVQSSLFAMFGNRERSSGNRATSGKSSDVRVANVSKEDYARCRAEGRCLRCRQTGHVARECTNPQKSNW